MTCYHTSITIDLKLVEQAAASWRLSSVWRAVIGSSFPAQCVTRQKQKPVLDISNRVFCTKLGRYSPFSTQSSSFSRYLQ